MSAHPNQAGLWRWAPTTLMRATTTARAASTIGSGVFVRPHMVNKAPKVSGRKNGLSFLYQLSCLDPARIVAHWRLQGRRGMTCARAPNAGTLSGREGVAQRVCVHSAGIPRSPCGRELSSCPGLARWGRTRALARVGDVLALGKDSGESRLLSAAAVVKVREVRGRR